MLAQLKSANQRKVKTQTDLSQPDQISRVLYKTVYYFEGDGDQEAPDGTRWVDFDLP